MLMPDDQKYHDELMSLANELVTGLVQARRHYGDSWKKRGGVGAFMVAIRKADRLEQQLAKVGYDVFAALATDRRAEGVADDIRDLASYLLLWMHEARRLNLWPPAVVKHAPSAEAVPRQLELLLCDSCGFTTRDTIETITGEFLCAECRKAVDVQSARSHV